MIEQPETTNSQQLYSNSEAVQLPIYAEAYTVDGKQFHYALKNDENIIGRNPHVQVVLAESSISRSHAVIIASAQGLLIQDLNSSNGTFVNEYPCMPDQMVPFQLTDQVRLGNVSLQFSREPQSGAWWRSIQTGLQIRKFKNNWKTETSVRLPNYAAQATTPPAEAGVVTKGTVPIQQNDNSDPNARS